MDPLFFGHAILEFGPMWPELAAPHSFLNAGPPTPAKTSLTGKLHCEERLLVVHTLRNDEWFTCSMSTSLKLDLRCPSRSPSSVPDQALTKMPGEMSNSEHDPIRPRKAVKGGNRPCLASGGSSARPACSPVSPSPCLKLQIAPCQISCHLQWQMSLTSVGLPESLGRENLLPTCYYSIP